MSDGTKPIGATSYRQTAFGIVPREKLLALEIEGTKRGLEFIYHLFRKNSSITITPELIVELHAVSFHWIFPEWAGKFRTLQVTYSGKEAPQYFHIPELVDNLCADLQVRLSSLPAKKESQYINNVVSLLAWFQHRFVFIHPFQDYNGRIARLLTVLVQLKLGLPPGELQIETESDRKQYLQAMQQADDGDLSVLEQLLSEALAERLLHQENS